jgi:hypothetical protein
MAWDIKHGRSARIMLVGADEKKLLERRLQAAGCQVIIANDRQEALDYARHEAFQAAVLVSKGSLINVAETIFNLRDLNGSMEIIVIVDRLDKPTNRFLRQLIEHPISGTQILTRRQLQRRLHVASPPAPPGASV